MSKPQSLTFDQALEILNIQDFETRIINSNGHGELFHLLDYIGIADALREDPSWYRDWFILIIQWAQENWKRPESVFQHIPRILSEQLNELKQ
jgi:hypothetical protein